MKFKSTMSIMFTVVMIFLGAQTVFLLKQIRDLREKIDTVEQNSEILSRHILDKMDSPLSTTFEEINKVIDNINKTLNKSNDQLENLNRELEKN